MQGPRALPPRDIEPTIKLIAIYLRKGLLTPEKVVSLMKPLPLYAERDRNGRVWFRVDRGPRLRLPNDQTSPEFRAAYSAALVDAAAAENDSDE